MTINGSIATIVVDHAFKCTVTQYAYMIYIEAVYTKEQRREIHSEATIKPQRPIAVGPSGHEYNETGVNREEDQCHISWRRKA